MLFKKKDQPRKIDNENKISYGKKIATLLTGTAIGQVIPLLAQLLIARMYTKVQFGEANLINSVFTILLVLTTCMYEQAIMLPEDDDDAFDIVIGSTVLSFVMSTIWLIIFCIAPVRVFVADIFDKASFANVLPWVSLYVFFGAGYQITNYWVNRKGMYKQLSSNRVIKAVSTSGINLAFGVKPFNRMFNGILVGRIAGEGVSWFGLMLRIWRKELHRFKKTSPAKVLAQMKRYRKFPMMIVPARLINAIAQQIPVFLLTFFFSYAVQGSYSMTYSVLAVPISLISRAVGDVFRERASEIYAKTGQCKDLLIKTAKPLLIYSCVPFALLMIFANQIVPFIFGSEWVEAGRYVQIMVPAFFVMFVVTPFSFMFMIAERQEFELLWQLGFIALTVSGFLIGYFVGGTPESAIAGFTSGHVIAHLVNGIVSYNLACGKLAVKR